MGGPSSSEQSFLSCTALRLFFTCGRHPQGEGLTLCALGLRAGEPSAARGAP